MMDITGEDLLKGQENFRQSYALVKSNEETAKLIAADKLYDKNYFLDGNVSKKPLKGKSKRVKKIQRYLDMLDDKFLLGEFGKYRSFIVNVVHVMDEELVITARNSDFVECDLALAGNNLYASREKINEVRDNLGDSYESETSFREIVANLRAVILMHYEMLLPEKVNRVLERIFFQSIAVNLIDADLEVPSEIKFKLDPEKRDRLSKTQAIVSTLIKVGQIEKDVQDKADEVLGAEAHPRIVERIKKNVFKNSVEKALKQRDDYNSRVQQLSAKFASENDYQDMLNLYNALIGKHYGEV